MILFFNYDERNDEIQMNDTFDSIYIELLLNSGVVKSNAYFYMNSYNDEKLIEAYKRVK